MYGLGANSLAVMWIVYGIPVYAALPLAIAAGALVGLFNGVLVTGLRIPSFIVTLGAMVVYRGVVLFFTRGAPVSIENEAFLDAYSGRTAGIPNSVLIALVLISVAAFMLVAAGFVLVSMIAGKFIRPDNPNPEKVETYE